MRCFARSRRQRTSGFTLIEVVVGTVLLATLVVSVLVAIGSHQRKIRHVRQKSLAIELADQMMSRWHQSTEGVPLSGRGSLSPDGSLAWQTRVIKSRQLCGVPVYVVRLDLFGLVRVERQPEQPNVLCSIDLVVQAKRDV